MDDEIELKLLVKPEAGDQLYESFIKNQQPDYTRNSSQLYNSYFDTPDKRLQSLGMACRVRGKDGKFEQTIKTRGESTGGLAQRPEYNVAIEGNKPNLMLFEAIQWPEDVSVRALQDDLHCLFDTHFERDVYLLNIDDDTEIECVFDSGMIETTKHQDPICEIELELKKGQASALLKTAKAILQFVPFRLGTQSKAQRGYRLVDGVRMERKRISEAIHPQTQGNVETVLMTALQEALSFWQHCEQFYLEEAKPRELQSIANVQGFIHKVTTLFGDYLSCPELKKVSQKAQSLRQSWMWAERVDAIRELHSSKGAFRKKLSNNDGLRKQLRVQLRDLLEQEKPEECFFNKEYTSLQLDVLELLLLKPWRKHGQAYLNDITDCASQWVVNTVKQIQTLIGSQKYATAQQAMTSYTLLKDMDYLALFLDESLLQRTHSCDVNWRNMLDGVVDLLTLQVFEESLSTMNLEDKASLTKWCTRKQRDTLELMGEVQHLL
ncbi:CYTH domain-containing protein [Alteromonas sp. a30]|uniref:CYTH domain-containing protein n=1 Tax=Alteromonas sp. a30 TaxID=2730917 RepID=UPI00227F30C3|nr:CYTH domain-containing protein [Alteromonas sp. a30]MCY7294276.1 CYTH domain-containing protein [Alteromonas sp. a30]